VVENNPSKSIVFTLLETVVDDNLTKLAALKLVAPVPPLAAGNVPVTLLAKFND
jgi:hypothetical protein